MIDNSHDPAVFLKGDKEKKENHPKLLHTYMHAYTHTPEVTPRLRSAQGAQVGFRAGQPLV